MPKRKITLAEAFATFEQHGLQVEVKSASVEPESDTLTLADFTHTPVPIPKVAERKSKTTMTITLHAAHSIGAGGVMVDAGTPNQRIENAGVETYGPGICTVPTTLVAHLLHQDALAKQADDRLLDRQMRSYLVVPRSVNGQRVNVGIEASQDGNFDMVSSLVNGIDHNIHMVR